MHPFAAMGLAVPNRVIYGILYVRTIYYTALQAPYCTLYSILFGILCNPSNYMVEPYTGRKGQPYNGPGLYGPNYTVIRYNSVWARLKTEIYRIYTV